MAAGAQICPLHGKQVKTGPETNIFLQTMRTIAIEIAIEIEIETYWNSIPISIPIPISIILAESWYITEPFNLCMVWSSAGLKMAELLKAD
jgi:hypothetical protein